MANEIEKDWTTKAGLRAVVIICSSRGRKTHRCGYVEVPAGHPLHGVAYSEQSDCLTREIADKATLGKKSPIILLTASLRSDGDNHVRRSPDVVFDVHGGLTFSGGGSDGYPVDSSGWWFGFDCAHSGDADIEPNLHYPSFRNEEGIVRELDYVEAECECLAQQIVDIVPVPVAA